MKILNTLANYFKTTSNNKINSQFNTTDNCYSLLENMTLDEKLDYLTMNIEALKNYVIPEQITLTSQDTKINTGNLTCYVIGNFVFISGVIRTTDSTPAGTYIINFSKNLRPKVNNIFQDYQQVYEDNLYRNRYLIEREHPERLTIRTYDTIDNNKYFGVNIFYRLDDYARHETT